LLSDNAEKAGGENYPKVFKLAEKVFEIFEVPKKMKKIYLSD
jgi:hypothetical protein